MTKKLHGLYYRSGYEIRDQEGKVVYSAKNHPLDSQAAAPKGEGLSLTTLEEFCNQTGEALARDMSATWRGCEFMQEED